MITSTKCNNYLMSHILLQLLLPARPGIHRSAGDRFCITVLVACVGPFLDYLYKPRCIQHQLGNVQAQKSSLQKTINRTKNHHLIFHRWWVKVNMIERTINQCELSNFFYFWTLAAFTLEQKTETILRLIRKNLDLMSLYAFSVSSIHALIYSCGSSLFYVS